MRIGMHTGVQDKRDVVVNKTSGRVAYNGHSLAIAKAVGDCGHGGMVLMTQSTFERLPINMQPGCGLLINMGDVCFTKQPDLPPLAVYQALPPSLEARLSL